MFAFSCSALQADGSDLYVKIDDGILLCKIINLASPDTIDTRVINVGKNISIFKVNGTSVVNVEKYPDI